MIGYPQTVPDRIDPRAESRRVELLLVALLLGSIVLRLVLAYLFPGYGPDLQTFKAWCIRITRGGPSGFFMTDWASQNVGLLHPLHAFLLWPLGWIWTLFDPTFSQWESPLFGAWVKLPAIIADGFSLLAIFAIARLYVKPRMAVQTASLLAWNPALLLIAAVWGHTDSEILALLLWGIAALLMGRSFLGVLSIGAAGLVRSHAWVFLPLAIALAMKRRRTADALKALAVLLVLVAAIGASFGTGHWWGLWLSQFSAHEVTTANAFNVWWPVGNWAGDQEPLFRGVDLSRQAFGLLFLLVVIARGTFTVWSNQDDAVFLRETILVGMGAYLLSTRVHERYMLYALGLMPLLPGYRRPFHLLSAVLSLNILWVLGASPAWGKAVEGGWGTLMAAINLVLYVGLWTLRDEDAAAHMGGERIEVEPPPPPAPNWLEPKSTGIVRLDRLDLILILILTVSFGLLRFYHLATPTDLLFDEVYHAKAGEEIMNGKAPNEWVHPPLAKLFIGLGIKAFGMNSFGWRFAPWLAGTLVLPFLYVLARNLILDRRCAMFAALLFGFDGCYFVLSRTAMTNIFALLFQIATLTFFLLYIKQASIEGGCLGYGWCLLLTSLSISLGISTRWTCLWLLVLVAAGYGLHTVWALSLHAKRFTPGHRVFAFFLATASGILHFILIPLAIYLASYAPLVMSHAYPDYHYVVSLQPQIWKFHTTFTTHHPYYSQWYTWCLTNRPVWYHYKEESGMIFGIIALGTPFLWWLSMPAIVIATCLAIRWRQWLILYSCAAWAGLYLPWALSPRVLNYSHYYTEPLPHACIALAWLASLHLARDRSAKTEVLVFVGLIALTFAFFYPLYAAIPLPRDSYDLRIWSRNWI